MAVKYASFGETKRLHRALKVYLSALEPCSLLILSIRLLFGAKYCAGTPNTNNSIVIMSNSVEAEAKKELGNQAFGSKDYEKASSYYTEAIELDPTNHVYFSNRSACYASTKKWEKSAIDAKECIKLQPSFVKGYYRLALAQIELKEYESAESSIKQGLHLDPDNSQLLKLLRTVKVKMQSSRPSASNSNTKQESSSALSQVTPSSTMDPAVSREILDLQEQYATTSREHGVIKANINKSQREQTMNEITISEINKIPSESTSKMYRGIGKMFMLSSRDEILDNIHTTIESDKKKIVESTQKMEYFERRMKSQQQNMQELVSSSSKAAE